MTQQPNVDVSRLWQYVAQQMKSQSELPSVWRALEAAVPITIENDELILGFKLGLSNQQGLLNETRNRNMMEQIIEGALKRRLRIRLIAGDSMADWEMEKQSLAEGARLSQSVVKKQQKIAEAGTTWDAVCDRLVRTFSESSNRILPSAQGRYLDEALSILAESYPRLMSDQPSEIEERAFSRALDRVTERTGVPGALVSYMMFERLRKQG